jgi:hypothetical protein
MQRRKYGSDNKTDSATQPSPDIEKTEPLSAERVPLPVEQAEPVQAKREQIEPQAESALTVLLRQTQEAEAKAAEWQKAQEELRRTQAAMLMAQRAQLPLEDRLSMMPNLSDAKRSFIRNHPEILDRPDSGTLHFGALDLGIPEDSPAYFNHIENGLAANNAEKPFTAGPLAIERPAIVQQAKELAKQQPRSSGPVVSAPVSRDSISISTGKPLDTRVRLTAEQREIAHLSMPGIPKAEAEKAYAKNLLKMQTMKAGGLLQDGDGR